MTDPRMTEGLDKPFDPRDEVEATALAEQNAQALANGEPTITRKRKNRWRFDAATERFDLDTETGEFIEFRPMDGGMKSEYERRTARDMYMQTGGKQSMKMSLDPSRDREALLEISVTGWNLERPEVIDGVERWVPVQFTKATLREWLRHADPVDLTELEMAVRAANPWLLNDQSLEDLKAARDELDEQIRAKEDLEGE